MKQQKIYQCYPSKAPFTTSRQIKKIMDEVNFEILLDLEDSIQNVVNPDLTTFKKIKARLDLVELISYLPKNKKYHLRINSVKEENFKEDLVVINKIKGSIKSIFLPKIETREDLYHYFQHIGFDTKVSLIIETQLGIKNLNQIFQGDFFQNIDYVFFGNYDYHLDANHYPIIDQNDINYWNFLSPIIKKIEQLGYSFGNSPYSNIGDLNTLFFTVKQLNKICEKPYALMSLHRRQSLSLQEILLGNQHEIKKQTSHSKEFMKTKKIKGDTFFYTNDGRIITPHEYVLIKRNRK